MKRILFLSLFCTSSFAQIGIRFGQVSAIIPNINEPYKKLNYHAGLMAGISYSQAINGKLTIQPELNILSYYRHNLKLKNSFSELQMPILIKYPMTNKFGFALGPQLNFVTNPYHKINFYNETAVINTPVNHRLKTAIVAGINYKLKANLVISARYSCHVKSYRLECLTKNFENHKNQSLSLSIEYKFNNKK